MSLGKPAYTIRTAGRRATGVPAWWISGYTVAKYPSHLLYAVLAMGIYGRHIAKGERIMPGPFDKMVCLVGENPLPVYLGIKQLAAPEAEVVLVYSEATKVQAGNIKKLLDKAPVSKVNRGRTCIMNQVVQLCDPFSPRQVRETLDAVLAILSNQRAYDLNYTRAARACDARELPRLALCPNKGELFRSRRAMQWSDCNLPVRL